jgi:hypothetical protein
MSGHFSGGCHFESAAEHERPLAAPSFNPYQAEHREVFSQIQNDHFANRGSYPFPEITINIGAEPECRPGANWPMPGPPRFYGQQQQWGGNYSYGNPYINDGGANYNCDQNMDDGGANIGNPNPGGNPFYGNNPGADNSAPAGQQNPNDAPLYTGAPAGPSSDIGSDIAQSSYTDNGVAVPHANYGYAPDASINPSATSDQSVSPAASPVAATDDGDYTDMINRLVNDVPLGTADTAGYITTPGDYNSAAVSTDQSTNAAPAAIDQSTIADPAATDQSTNAVPAATDQSTNAVPAAADQTTNVNPVPPQG